MIELAEKPVQVKKEKVNRKFVSSKHPSVFTQIYQEEVNLAVWQQEPTDSLIHSALSLIQQQPNFKAVMTVTPDETYQHLTEYLADFSEKHALCEHVALLADMFCTLFELKRVGLRLTALDRPMCPKFHVDKVPCRLITTFTGRATQWLKNEDTDRSKLGAGSLGMLDEASGLFHNKSYINNLLAGDVALLKGESWFNNEGGGLVHRSPALAGNEKRLLLTLDFIE